ncbi:C2H2-type zinc finger protein ASCRUDRAFT_16582, partial [Ascoidea rubescens DSM 1968]
CPLCKARFHRPEHVKRHLRSHSSEKPFHCDQPGCNKRFNRNDNLKAHLRKIH